MFAIVNDRLSDLDDHLPRHASPREAWAGKSDEEVTLYVRKGPDLQWSPVPRQSDCFPRHVAKTGSL